MNRVKVICDNGHTFYKSSNCRTCPTCEKKNKPTAGFLMSLAAPARRALEKAGINSIELLSQTSEAELLKLHGFGPTSIPKLRQELLKHNLDFKEIN
jgi:predicted RecB family nuclease